MDYFPATNILEVAQPYLYDFMLPEVLNSIDTLVGNIVNFDVKSSTLGTYCPPLSDYRISPATVVVEWLKETSQTAVAL